MLAQNFLPPLLPTKFLKSTPFGTSPTVGNSKRTFVYNNEAPGYYHGALRAPKQHTRQAPAYRHGALRAPKQHTLHVAAG
jgi:hypothetical protein